MSSKGKKAEATKRAPEAPAAPASDLPLFFSTPQVISLERHGKARLRPDLTLSFARHTNSIPLAVTEIVEAAKHYPVALTMAEPLVPIAIVGLEKENYFVDEKGRWMEYGYVPAYVRKYPFVFTQLPGGDQLTLCIDGTALAPEGDSEGSALYDGDKPTQMTQAALDFCTAYQQEHARTMHFCDMLKQLNLLTPQRSDIKLPSQRTIQLNGFQLIDVEKLQALTDAQTLDLHKQGALAPIYYMLQSQSNWRLLLDLAGQRETGAAA